LLYRFLSQFFFACLFLFFFVFSDVFIENLLYVGARKRRKEEKKKRNRSLIS